VEGAWKEHGKRVDGEWKQKKEASTGGEMVRGFLSGKRSIGNTLESRTIKIRCHAAVGSEKKFRGLKIDK
jgi:hypothetical protein